jgi:integrase
MSDLNAVYRAHMRRRAHSDAQVGAKTQRERRVVIERALRDLYASGYKLVRLKNLRGRHVRVILTQWESRGLKSSTFATNLSHLRNLCRWIRKPQLLDLIARILAERPELTRRSLVAQTDRSETATGVEAVEFVRRARELDERFAAQLALIAAFGLRSQEAWLFRPHLAEVPGGCIEVRYGAKGGRLRVLPSMSDLQRGFLEHAKTYALSKPESLVPRDWTVQRWRRRYYRLCARIGLTRGALGATPHSIRHGVLADLYEALTGHPPPVRGGDLPAQDPYADRAARDLVGQHAGHSRRSVTAAYLGGARARRPAPQDGAVPAAPASNGRIAPPEATSPDSAATVDVAVPPTDDIHRES